MVKFIGNYIHYSRTFARGAQLFVLLLTAMAFSTTSVRADGPALFTGVDTVVMNNLYVVYSGLNENGKIRSTSNIYVLKGRNDSVWIFGSGYGDDGDLQSYFNNTIATTRNSLADAADVDSIITHLFNLNRQDVKLQFIVPHFHLDHVNQEFIATFFGNFNYNLAPSNIYVHINDSIPATCNAPCCGNVACSDTSDLHFGSPHHTSWTPNFLQKFKAIGSASDNCNDPIMRISSPSGPWVLRKASNSHTPGTVNLTSSLYRVKIMGSMPATPCPTPPGFTKLRIHGTIGSGFHYYPEPPVELCQGDSIEVFGQWRYATGVYRDTLSPIGGSRRNRVRVRLVEFLPSYNIQETLNLCAGDSAFVMGGYRTTPGVFTLNATTTEGCDSIVETTVQFDTPVEVQEQVSFCKFDSVWVAGAYRHQSQVIEEHLTSIYGCDSTVTHELTVLPVANTLVTHQICSTDSFNWNGTVHWPGDIFTEQLTTTYGCDSVVTHEIATYSIQNSYTQQSFCEGDTAFWNGQIITTNTSINTVFTAANGCDSTSITEFTFDPAPPIPTIVATDSLTISSQIVADDYRWWRNETMIQQGTSEVQPQQSGWYGLQVLADGCWSDTGFYHYSPVGIESMNILHHLEVYPNPADDQLIIKNTGGASLLQIALYDLSGRLVLHLASRGSTFRLDVSSLSAGIYQLKVIAPVGIDSRKIVIQ